jgi:hypothetical protein
MFKPGGAGVDAFENAAVGGSTPKEFILGAGCALDIRR